jgi:hypothetical protein
MGHLTPYKTAHSPLHKPLSNIADCPIFHFVANVGISVASLRFAGEGEGCDGPASGIPQPPLRTPFTGTFRKE